MPEQVRCPSCEATLRVPDSLLGANVKCPKCATTFTAEVTPAGSIRPKPDPIEEPRSRRPAYEEERRRDDEDDYDDRPRRRRRRRYSSSSAASEVTGPAIALMVVSGLSLVGGLVHLVLRLVELAVIGTGPVTPPGASSSYAAGQAAGYTAGLIFAIIFDVLSMVIAILIAAGAVKMKNLQSYGLALTASILAIIPMHCCCILGIPFGIWGLVVLNKPDVKDAFS